MAVSATPPAGDTDEAWPRAHVVLLLALTLLATALRFCRIEQWSWSDGEAVTWRAITSPVGDLLFSGPGLAPLGYLGLRWLGNCGLLPGHGEGWLRLPFAFCGVVAVPLLALVARPLVGAVPALLAAGLLAVHPLHVAVSQSTQPVSLAVLLALAAALCCQHGARRIGWVVAIAACLCAPIVWSGVVAVAASRLRPVLGERVLLASLAVAAVLAPFTLGALSLPLVVVAAVGWVHAAPRTLRFATALPLAIASLAACAPGVERGAVLVFVLPGFVLFAAIGLHRLFVDARANLRGAPRVTAVGAALASAVVATWLGVDVFQYLTTHRGERPPWRSAGDAVWVAANGPGGLVVGAAAGQKCLTCYLRPNHWRGGAGDPHPGTTVLPLDLAAAGALDELAARPETQVLLVLRQDEVAHLGEAPRQQLDNGFELLRIVPSPQAHGDATLFVYRRASAR